MVKNNIVVQELPQINLLMGKRLKNLVIVSYSFEGLGVGLKALTEGLNCFIIRLEPTDAKVGLQKEIKEEKRMLLGGGLIDVVDKNEGLKRLQSLNPEETFIFYDFNWGHEFGEEIRKLGFRGLIPSAQDREFEKDRDKAKKFVKANYKNLLIPEEYEFNSVKEAIDFLSSDKGKESIWVFKSHGDFANTFVPPFDDVDLSREILIEYLVDNQKNIEKSHFILERKIRKAIEFTPQAWFDFEGNPLGASIDVELKHIGNYNTSYLSGCSADFFLYLPINSLAFEWFLQPIMEYVQERKQQGRPVLIWDASVLYEPESGNYYFGEFCFDKETEILTKEGWKKYDEVKVGDYALSLNPKTLKMEWKPIVKKWILLHNGEMIDMKTRDFDALVTPEHKFFVFDWKKKSFVNVRAKDLKQGHIIPRTGIWKGKDIPEIVLEPIAVKFPEKICKRGSFVKKNEEGKKLKIRCGRGYVEREYVYGVQEWKRPEFPYHYLKEQKYKTEDMAWFIGLWLAEGSCGSYYKGEPRTIIIAQSLKNPKRKIIKERLNKIGLKYKIAKDGSFVIHNRRLAIYLWEELGLKNVHAHNKFIPSFYKELAPKYLKELLEGFALGDGYYHKNQYVITTASKRLVDDLQEIIHKLGWVATIKIKEKGGSTFVINGKQFKRNYDIYTITTRHSKTSRWVVPGKNMRTVHYSGIVWDVEVADNHTLFVRRNGRAFFSSNCSGRTGYNFFYTELAVVGSVTEFFEKIINGENPYKNCEEKYGSSIRLFNLFEIGNGLYEQFIIPQPIDIHTWLMDTYKEGKNIKTVGYDANSLVLTAVDYDPYVAIIKVQEKALNPKWKTFYFRTDLTQRFEGSLFSRLDFLFSGDIIWSKLVL